MDNNTKNPPKTYYYKIWAEDVKEEWDIYRPIYQYMKLEFFLNLMYRKKYFVNIKKNFDDKNEGRLPFSLSSFGLSVVGAPISTEEMAEKSKKREKVREDYSKMGILPTSCWTYHKNESILMWNAYAFPYGIRIKTDVNSYLDNLDYFGYTVYCGFMHYDGYNDTKEHNMFSKERMYEDEREFRFYFKPKDKDIAKRINEDGHICLDILDLKGFIEEVNLSPYIKKNYALKQLIEGVCHEYGIKVSISRD